MSVDLPFAMNRFCGAEGIKNMKVGSDYYDKNFGKATGMLIELADVGSNPYFMIFGYEPASLPAQGLDLVSGRLPSAADDV